MYGPMSLGSVEHEWAGSAVTFRAALTFLSVGANDLSSSNGVKSCCSSFPRLLYSSSKTSLQSVLLAIVDPVWFSSLELNETTTYK